MSSGIPSKPEHLDRVGEIIRSGNCVLFLGAGVSIDSGAPSGKKLAQELSKHFLPDDPVSDDLGGVCELIDADAGRKTLNDYLIARFEGLQPKGALLSIPDFHWKSIYTVNVDVLLEGAYAQSPNAKQRLRPFYSDKDPIARLQPGEVPLYKLHGCLSRAYSDDGRLVLTPDDFLRVRNSRQRFFNRLLDEAADFTIFYVGFARQDIDFRQVLIEVQKASGSLEDLRRSYALQPNYLPSEEKMWEQRRVSVIDAKAGDFFRSLEGAFPSGQRYIPQDQGQARQSAPLLSRKPQLNAEVLIDIERNFEIVDERIRHQAPNTDAFFSGAQPNWGTIAAGADARRDLADELLTAVLHDPHLDRSGVQFLLLHSEAGSGKTTTLRRLGVDLALTWERIVVSLKPFGDLEFLPLERLVTIGEERVYVLVDDAAGLGRDLNNLLNMARRAKTRLTVVAAARTNEWREIQENHSFANVEEFELPQLSRAETEAVIETLTTHNALGLLAGVSHEGKIAAFEDRANKQLLVALREATEGKNFDEIIVDEYDHIPSPEGQRAYLLVASLHRFGILTRAGLLHRALGLPLTQLGRRVLEPTTKIIVTQTPLDDRDYYYTTRHPLIAEIVFDRKLISDRRRAEHYQDLIEHFDLGYSSDRDAYRKLTRGKNKLLLRDFSSVDYRREVMRQLVQVDPSDAFALQHAAIMEIRENNLVAASKHLNRAIELLPQDESIRDTEGVLVLQSAVVETNPSIADEKFALAEDIFRRNIQRRRDEPYSYKHLAETFVSWAKRKPKEQDRLRYFGLAYEALLDGIEKCGSTAMLLQYQADLEQHVFDNPERARVTFAEVLEQRPDASIARFLAAKLEEREGAPERALAILRAGLEIDAHNFKLHFRIAQLMAILEPERDAEIRSHFEAALLGPLRDYAPRLSYAAYLFSQRDFGQATEQFAQLDQLIVSKGERFEARRFEYGWVAHRQTGRIKRLGYNYSSVEIGHGATEVRFNLSDSVKPLIHQLRSGQVVSFDLRFNLKGPIAVNVQPSPASPNGEQHRLEEQLPLSLKPPAFPVSSAAPEP